MNILLAVDHRNDPHAVGAYLKRRFGTKQIHIDILTVIPASIGKDHQRGYSTNETARSRQQSNADFDAAYETVFAAEDALRDLHGFRNIRVHVKMGSVAESIMATAKRLRSKLLVIDAPPKSSLFNWFGMGGITRTMLRHAQCPIEITRPLVGNSRSPFNVLVPIGSEQAARFPYEQLAGLLWPHQGRLQLLGVVSPAIDETLTDVSAVSLLDSIHCSQDAHFSLQSTLSKVTERLQSELKGKMDVDYRIIEGSTREIVLDCAQHLDTQLIVLSSAPNEYSLRGLFTTLSPAAIAMSASCPVLLLPSAKDKVAYNPKTTRVPLHRAIRQS